MQVKLTSSTSLIHKTELLVEMDGREIIDANAQIDLANNPGLAGPLDKIGEQVTADAEVPIFAGHRHAELPRMLKTKTFARSEGQRADDFARDLGKQIQAGW